ncbi:MAG: hypothetical protein WC631_00055 [Candidatus Paceibacterota bacterium]
MNKQQEGTMKVERGFARSFEAQIDLSLQEMLVAGLNEIQIPGKTGMFIMTKENRDMAVAKGATVLSPIKSHEKTFWVVQLVR